jgi:hypothetical protein
MPVGRFTIDARYETQGDLRLIASARYETQGDIRLIASARKTNVVPNLV